MTVVDRPHLPSRAQDPGGSGEHPVRCAGVHGRADVEGRVAHDEVDRPRGNRRCGVVAERLDAIGQAVRGSRLRGGGHGRGRLVGGDHPGGRELPGDHRGEDAGAAAEIDCELRTTIDAGKEVEEETGADVQAGAGEDGPVRDDGQVEFGETLANGKRGGPGPGTARREHA